MTAQIIKFPFAKESLQDKRDKIIANVMYELINECSKHGVDIQSERFMRDTVSIIKLTKALVNNHLKAESRSKDGKTL